jgi:GTPase involved in cell partitioning and DNA repair
VVKHLGSKQMAHALLLNIEHGYNFVYPIDISGDFGRLSHHQWMAIDRELHPYGHSLLTDNEQLVLFAKREKDLQEMIQIAEGKIVHMLVY